MPLEGGEVGDGGVLAVREVDVGEVGGDLGGVVGAWGGGGALEDHFRGCRRYWFDFGCVREREDGIEDETSMPSKK